MAQYAVADAVRDFSSTTGTGNITLNNTASTGYRTFTDALAATAPQSFLSVGDTVGICTTDTSTGVREIAIAKILSSGPVVLQRVTRTNGASLVNWPGGSLRQVDVVPLADALGDTSRWNDTFTGVTTRFFFLPIAFTRFRLSLIDFSVSLANSTVNLQLSNNGGSSFLTGAIYQVFAHAMLQAGTESLITFANQTSMQLSPGLVANSNFQAEFDLAPGNTAQAPGVSGLARGVMSTGPSWFGAHWHAYYNANGRCNAAQLLVSGGATMAGQILVEGIR